MVFNRAYAGFHIIDEWHNYLYVWTERGGYESNSSGKELTTVTLTDTTGAEGGEGVCNGATACAISSQDF